jgi:hypothetical protein
VASSVDIRRIVEIHLVHWEIDPDEWGVNWTRDDGYHGSDRIGTKEAAQKIVDDVMAQPRHQFWIKRSRGEQ